MLEQGQDGKLIGFCFYFCFWNLFKFTHTAYGSIFPNLAHISLESLETE